MDQNFFSFEYDNYQDLTHVLILMQCFIHVKVNFKKKSDSSLWEISISCTSQKYDNVTTPYYPFLLHYLSTGRLREVKNEGKFQTFSYKRGRTHLEVVAYKSL